LDYWLPDVNENVVSADLDGVTIDAHGGVLHELAGGHVVLPHVPGAGYYLPVEFAFAQRAAFMGAYTIDSAELTGNIGNCDSLAAYLKFVDLSGRHVLSSGGTHKGHLPPLIQVLQAQRSSGQSGVPTSS
jgi:hypothetical protein